MVHVRFGFFDKFCSPICNILVYAFVRAEKFPKIYSIENWILYYPYTFIQQYTFLNFLECAGIYLPGFHDKLPHINNCLTSIIASKMKFLSEAINTIL